MLMCMYIELMTISISFVDPWEKKKTMMTVFTQIQDESFPNS